MATDNDSRKGVVSSLRSAWEGLLEGLQHRTELFSVEMRQEKQRALGDLIATAAFLFCASMTLVATNVLLYVLFWDERLTLTLVLLGLYAAGTLAFGWTMRRRRANAPKPFSATIEEFRRDRTMVSKR